MAYQVKTKHKEGKHYHLFIGRTIGTFEGKEEAEREENKLKKGK